MCSSKNHGGLSLTSIKKSEMNGQEACVCPNDECGRTFEHPLQLTVLCSDPVETYLACPYCMSRIENGEEEQEDQELTKDAPIALKIKTALQKEQKRDNEEPEEPSTPKCTHNFGYLKKRPKGTSIPDECLVCPKMIQCLSG
jgi:DNA-directed RNA polymerase subunit RPC12/RpoP